MTSAYINAGSDPRFRFGATPVGPQPETLTWECEEFCAKQRKYREVDEYFLGVTPSRAPPPWNV